MVQVYYRDLIGPFKIGDKRRFLFVFYFKKGVFNLHSCLIFATIGRIISIDNEVYGESGERNVAL
jgi:hypothetical protein